MILFGDIGQILRAHDSEDQTKSPVNNESNTLNYDVNFTKIP